MIPKSIMHRADEASGDRWERAKNAGCWSFCEVMNDRGNFSFLEAGRTCRDRGQTPNSQSHIFTAFPIEK